MRALFCGGLLLPQAGAQRVDETAESWRVRLLAPVSTEFNRKGDMVSARVLEPAAYQGSVLEGVISEITPGGARGHDSTVGFSFHTLHAPSGDVTVSAELLRAANSRGEAGVDEAGSPLAAGGRDLGTKLGRVLQRESPVSLRFKAHAEQLSLAPGTELTLQVKRKQHR